MVGNMVEQAREERVKRIRKEAEKVVFPSKLFWCFYRGQQFAKKFNANMH